MATFDVTSPEVWYPIPGRAGYEISSHFRIRSWRRPGHIGVSASPKILRVQGSRGNRYLSFAVRDGRKTSRVYLHHVVAELAIGPRPTGLSVLHEDDDHLNNHPSNLRYGTPQANYRDAVANGRVPHGLSRANTKLSDEQVAEIVQLRREGVACTEIASRYGISDSMVSMIATGRRRGRLAVKTTEAGIREALGRKGK